MLSKEQVTELMNAQKKFTVVKHYQEKGAPGRLFIWMDDGINSGGLDNSTHEIQVFPDGTTLGEYPGEEERMVY